MCIAFFFLLASYSIHSKYYNYAVSNNGKKEAHGDNYAEDYFTDLIRNHSVDFIHTNAKGAFPFFMYIATHTHTHTCAVQRLIQYLYFPHTHTHTCAVQRLIQYLYLLHTHTHMCSTEVDTILVSSPHTHTHTHMCSTEVDTILVSFPRTHTHVQYRG